MSEREPAIDELNKRLDGLGWRVIETVIEPGKVVLSFQYFDPSKGPTRIIRNISAGTTRAAKLQVLEELEKGSA